MEPYYVFDVFSKGKKNIEAMQIVSHSQSINPKTPIDYSDDYIVD